MQRIPKQYRHRDEVRKKQGLGMVFNNLGFGHRWLTFLWESN